MRLSPKLLKLTAVFLLISLSGCNKVPEDQSMEQRFESSPKAAGMNFTSQRETNSFLAYEHTLTIKISEAKLEQQYNQTIQSCSKNVEFQCVILGTRLETGSRRYAMIRLRINPKGLNKLIQTAAGEGRVEKKSTHVKDLARPIRDNTQRRSMLKNHQNQLLKLQNRPDNNIDSLIKISSELAKIQADLEYADGQNVHLMKRVKLDLVRFYFEVEHQNSFLNPIVKVLKDFSNIISEGVAHMIWVVGYALPWGVMIGFLGWIVRLVWKRAKRKSKN